MLFCCRTNLLTLALSAGGADTSHQRWELDQKALVSPDAIICAGLALQEGAGRHFRQSPAQHQRILAVLKAIGPGSDVSSDTRGSGMDAASSLGDTVADAKDADGGMWGRTA